MALFNISLTQQMAYFFWKWSEIEISQCQMHNILGDRRHRVHFQKRGWNQSSFVEGKQNWKQEIDCIA